MAFNSLEYGIFLVAVFLLYWGLAKTGTLRIGLLLVASWIFYAASNPWFLLLIWASTITDYWVGRAMGASEEEVHARRRKALLWLSMLMNLGLLGVFKYSNMFYELAVDLSNALGADLTYTKLDIILPVGISFYTFQTMSYSIDVYRRRLKPERDFWRFALFVGYFPQLVAGPIVRAVDFLPQLQRTPYFSKQQASRAMWLIAIGIGKKVLIADFLGVHMAQRVFESPEVLSSLDVLLGLYGYTMQMYMDFSAYTDIAIGSAILFGFRLPDNFDRPYMATSVQDFWRRWHKTLGSWLRDYLYYPLGGGRGTPLKVYRNLFITFLLIGLWHGADVAFLVYGAGHATAMCINRYLRKRRERLGIELKLGVFGTVWRVLLTLHFVALMRVLFAADAYGERENISSFAKAGEVFAALGEGTYTAVSIMTPTVWAILIGSYLWHWTPRSWTEASFHAFRRLPFVVQGLVFGLVLLAIQLLSTGQRIPFQYFQF